MPDKATQEALQKIQVDLRELKDILAKVIGTIYESPENRFNEQSLDKAVKDFRKWFIERNDWVKEREIGVYLKSANWHSGIFIRKAFEFTNWVKRGHDLRTDGRKQ